MRSVAKALKTFVSSFDLPAYATDTVPDEVPVPYLVYPLSEPEWNQKASFYIQGWYRTNSYSEMMEKADQIVAAIGTGIIIPIDEGHLVLYPETPLVQTISDDDFRSFYISLSMNAYHMPGL